MDCLNNIWIALNTENVELVNILLIPFGFVESFLVFALLTTIFNLSPSKKDAIAYVCFSAILGIISNYIIPSPYNVFISYIGLFILTKWIFKMNVLYTIIAVISQSLVFVLIISLLSNPFLNVFHITYIQLENIPIYRLLLLITVYITITIVLIFIKFRKTKLLLPKTLNKKTRNIFTITFIFGIIIICSQAFMIAFYLDVLPIIYTLLTFLSLLIYFGLSIYSLNKVVQLEQTTMDLKNSEEYNNTLQIMHDNVRCFKHDFDNIITTIGGYIATEDMEGLKKYYKELEKDCKTVNNSYILNPKIINNPGVYSILINKYKRAEDLNINVNLEYLLDMNNLQMDVYQFTRILGILLDNAIEAAENSKEKLINIYFREETNNNRQIILIENSYSNKNVDTESIYEKNKTEKENHSGLGLYEVRKIINKNNNINLYTSKDDILFKQQLEIYF